MKRPATITAIVLLFALLSACGSDGSDGDSAAKGNDAGAASAPTSSFGAGCTNNGDCPEGLLCLQSEYTPTAFCTKFCDSPKDYCDSAEMGGANALCVQMPGAWNGPTRNKCDAGGKCEKVGRPFCAPICDNSSQCTSRWKSWEKCAKPAYKNVLIYNDLPTKVCMAPSSHGQIVIDPRTCDWESKITEPAVQEAKQLCKAHCDFLTKCQLFDPKTEAASCCTWRCFQKMTPEGVIDQDRKETIKCFIKAFSAARGTPKVCALYKDQCPDLEHPRG